MTTKNEFNQTTFKSGTSLIDILSFALINGINETEKVIKNTYLKSDSDYIISVINSLN